MGSGGTGVTTPMVNGSPFAKVRKVSSVDVPTVDVKTDDSETEAEDDAPVFSKWYGVVDQPKATC